MDRSLYPLTSKDAPSLYRLSMMLDRKRTLLARAFAHVIRKIVSRLLDGDV